MPIKTVAVRTTTPATLRRSLPISLIAPFGLAAVIVPSLADAAYVRATAYSYGATGNVVLADSGTLPPPTASASSASADGAASTMASVDEATGLTSMTGSSTAGSSEAVANVFLSDALTFNEPGKTTIQVTFDYDVSGSVVNNSTASSGFVTMQLGGEPSLYEQTTLSGLLGPHAITWTVPTGTSLAFYLNTQAIANYGDSFNFSDPGQLSVQLPTGASIQSASGEFLTQAPVPLPAAVWLLLSGLGGLGMFARKQSG